MPDEPSHDDPIPARYTDAICISAAAFALIGAVCRACKIGVFDHETLLFIAVAPVILLVSRLKKFVLTKDGIEFLQFERELQKVRQEVEAVGKKVDEGQIVAAGNAQAEKELASFSDEHAELPVRAPGPRPDDPWAAVFPDQPKVNGARLIASYSQSQTLPNKLVVTLQLKLDEPFGEPPAYAMFYLHPTFHDHIRKVPIVDRQASLKLLAYGAFTAGVQVGQTELGIDLANEVYGFPEWFRSR